MSAETTYELHQGDNAGWSYLYYDHLQKKKMLVPEYGGAGEKRASGKTIHPVASFPAYIGPNGLLFYTSAAFPERY